MEKLMAKLDEIAKKQSQKGESVGGEGASVDESDIRKINGAAVYEESNIGKKR